MSQICPFTGTKILYVRIYEFRFHIILDDD